MVMNHMMILSVVTFIYFLSFVFYLLRLIFGKDFWGSVASVVTLFGFAAQTLALILRWKSSYALGIGHIPLTSFYESLIFFSWMIIMIYLLTERRIQNKAAGVFIVPIAFIAMAYASFSPDVSSRIEPLIPALQSNWLTGHVFTCFLSYAAFAVAFGFALLYLLKNNFTANPEKGNGFINKLPSSTTLNNLIYQNTLLGFIFLTIGMVIGSIWAHHAWGSYWNWDPKEIWALITWFIYAIMLYSRHFRDLSGKRLAIIALIGFASVLFTYLGVNYFPGLHSYFKF